LTVTRALTSRNGNRFTLANIWWRQGTICPGFDRDQSVVFRNVQFRVDNNFQEGDKIYLVDTTRDLSESNNVLTVEGGHIGVGFNQGLLMNQGGTWCFNDVTLAEPLWLTVGGTATPLFGRENRLTIAAVNGQITETGCREKLVPRLQQTKIPIPHKPVPRQ
jgi:hypothetical protein